MFRQVKDLKEDTDYLRSLWYENFNGSIDKYIIHVYSKGEPPCCANWGLKRTAIDSKLKFSLRVTEAVLEHLYMDDYSSALPDF